MKLVCFVTYADGITFGNTYVGQMVVGSDNKIWFVAFNDDRIWKHYELEFFIPRAE
jgi:hypothetical protein